MSKKPVIGVTEPSSFTDDCISTIENFFGANPLKLCGNVKEDIEEWVDQCVGVILAGGIDIHPQTYGYAVLNVYGFTICDRKRVFREIHIINRCLEKDIPILGICRGHQMLGVFHGLDLVPDLTGTLVCHQPQKQQIAYRKDEPMHWVRLIDGADEFQPDGAKKSILCHPISRDANYLWVNSFHHQGLAFTPNEERVDAIGFAPGHKDERIIELMKGINHRWISCQWHPEYDWTENPSSKMVLEKFRDLMNGETLQRVSFPKPSKSKKN